MQNNTKLTLKFYWQEVKKQKLAAFFLLFGVIGSSAIGVFIPLLFKRFFDILTSAGDRTTLATQLLTVLGMVAILEGVRWLFWLLCDYTNTIFQTSIMKSLGLRCFTYLHRHSFSFFNNNFVGSLVKRVNYFSHAFERIADRTMYSVIPLILEIGIILAILYKTHFTLGLGISVWILLFLAMNILLAQYKLKYDILRSEAETKTTGYLADTITNNSTVKLFTGYNREVHGYQNLLEIVRRLRRFAWNLDTIFQRVQGFLCIALELAIFYLAIGLWRQGILTIGDFVLIQTYMVVIFEKVWNFGKVFRQFYSDLADAEDMTLILNTPHEITDIQNAKQLKVASGKIIFENVGFYYHETRKIFSGLNLAIAPREKVALIGPSGAGKSTIIKLLMRMHDLSAGSITVDGQNIAAVTQESLWSAISLVPQDPILFHRSLMENIRYGKPDATDDEVITAAKLARCDEFIMELADKYGTFVGERGIKLSGGERQRVAIARAILRNAPIIVLDEATSSLDSESEAKIQEALVELMKNKTVIVIAHRLSTIMKMDRIVVVDHGEIIEAGTHAELLKKESGVYARLWKIQAGGFIP
ncbi:MAG: ABC transporter ATP-binding protein [Patescibacteria group bacterium]